MPSITSNFIRVSTARRVVNVWMLRCDGLFRSHRHGLRPALLFCLWLPFPAPLVVLACLKPPTHTRTTPRSMVPAKARRVDQAAAMFIDDNSSATNNFLRWLHCPPTAESVAAHLQKDAQVWERSLFTSGGLLKLKKCLYYIMYWEFDDEGRPSLRSAGWHPFPPLDQWKRHSCQTNQPV
jgi:hypothetical protein